MRTQSIRFASFAALTVSLATAFATTGCAKSSASSNVGSTSEEVTTSFTLYPTGQENNAPSDGGVLPEGSVDPHYQIVATNDPKFDASSPLPAYVVLGADIPWPVKDEPTGAWIAPKSDDCSGTCGADTYDYATNYSLPSGADASTAMITGTVSADDSVVIYVNGQQTTASFTNAYSSTSSFTITKSSSITDGGTIAFLNPDGAAPTIDFKVSNSGSGPTGLFVHTLAISVQTQCNVDADCVQATQYCNVNINTCVPRLAAGVTTTTDSVHNGGCPTIGAAECSPNTVCDPTDNACGYAPGDGPCTVLTELADCRSGLCGAGTGKCLAALGGCNADDDCDQSTSYCDGTTKLCALKILNDNAIPNDGIHDGTCTTANAATCATGACDSNGNVCGVKITDGTCTSTNQCITGVCITTTNATNFDKCEACASDLNCLSLTTPACDTSTNTCVACTTSNKTGCTGATPICNTTTESCVACNGDNGTTATHACPTSGAPVCNSDGSCGVCTLDSQCAGGTRLGTICNTASGACGTACTVDADCPGAWCDDPTAAVGGGTCAPKIANGQPVPSDAPTNSTCTTAVGLRVCVSAACYPGDNDCGLPNSIACTSASVCRSNVCNADGKCGDPNGTTCASGTTCRSGVCDSDNKCGEPNGEACANDAVCRTGVCSTADDRCGLLNAETCTQTNAAACRSAVCYTDNKCGEPTGGACASGNVCRSGACVNNVCSALCKADGDCASGSYCAPTGQCLPTVANGQEPGSGCTRAAQCTSRECNADGLCGDPNGATCTSLVTCRSGICTGGQCGAAPSTCSTGTQCADGVCASDGMCGATNGSPCGLPTDCRSSICQSGACVASCANDVDCPAADWCNAGACAPDATNGQKPAGTACTRGAQCTSGVCDSDGSCGEVNGEACSSPVVCRSGVCDTTTNTCGTGAVDAGTPIADAGPDSGASIDAGLRDASVSDATIAPATDAAVDATVDATTGNVTPPPQLDEGASLQGGGCNVGPRGGDPTWLPLIALGAIAFAGKRRRR